MAIYHFHAELISRERGQSVVACAAYRAGEKLYDERLGRTWDYTHKAGVEHSEILAPREAPSWVHDRERLWNTVEKVERRKDSQLARQVIMGVPRELSADRQLELLREFAKDTFVSRGMIADAALHLDDPGNPHAHILLSLRNITSEGFGRKRRDWNHTHQLKEWRAEWAEMQNRHLALAGFDIRVDHRTLEAQGLDLVPGRKIGISAERQRQPDLPRNLAERIEEQRDIAAENGRRIIADPDLALRALTHMRATFTKRDIGKYLHTRTDGAEQFDRAFLKATTSAELVELGKDEEGRVRYTTHEMLGVERNLLARVQRLTASSHHVVSPAQQERALEEAGLSSQQKLAFERVAGPADLAVAVGFAGTGKSTMLKSARETWEAAGCTVKGASLAGIAAENLENASGIRARTLASWELSWSNDRDMLSSRDVLVIDEAGLVGTRQLDRVLEHVEKAGAKGVLIGDPEQLQAIEAGAAFRGIAEQAGMVEINEVRRQKAEWQKEATQQLTTGRTIEALQAYHQHGAIQMAPTREVARKALVSAWRETQIQDPAASRMMLAYTGDDARRLNEIARELRQAAGELGDGHVIQTERGPREFAIGDRLYFLRNERSLGVKNGSLGTLEQISDGVLQIRLDGDSGRRVTVDPAQYSHLDHGYATTVHKSLSATVDHTFTLVTPHFDRHSTYVALSRHRESTAAFYAAEDFDAGGKAPPLSADEIQERFQTVLSRAGPQELAHDYLDRGDTYGCIQTPDVGMGEPPPHRKPKMTFPTSMSEIDALQQRAAERWRDKHLSREIEPSPQVDLHHEKELHPDLSDPSRPEHQKRHELEHPGPEDDLEL